MQSCKDRSSDACLEANRPRMSGPVVRELVLFPPTVSLSPLKPLSREYMRHLFRYHSCVQAPSEYKIRTYENFVEGVNASPPRKHLAFIV